MASPETFLNLEIQRSQYIRPKVTVHKCAEIIQGRKLFKGGNFMRKYGPYRFFKLQRIPVPTQLLFFLCQRRKIWKRWSININGKWHDMGAALAKLSYIIGLILHCGKNSGDLRIIPSTQHT